MHLHLWTRNRSIGSRRVLRVVVSTIAFTLLITANRAFAIITGFLPGDACFGSSLSEDRLAQIDADGPVVFPYRAGEGELAGCGYSGYWNLSVRNMPVEMKANLKNLYGALRQRDPRSVEILTDKKGNERRVETNPYFILIYNKDYDLHQGIGLKFNEAWMKLDMQKYDKPTSGAYWPYVTEHEAVARDWEGGARVPGLAINEADARPWWGDRIETPVSIDADRIQILVLPERLYKSFALGSGHWRDVPWDELPLELEIDAVIEPHFFRVTSEGVARCHYGDGFVEEPWPLTPAQMQAEKIEKIIGALDRAATETFSIGDEQPLPAEIRQDLYELREKMDALQEKLTELSESLEQQPAASPPPSNE